MRFGGASPYFMSQRLGRWRWPWLLVGFAASALGLALGFGATVGGIELLQLTEAPWAENLEVLLSGDDEALIVEPFGVAGMLLFIGVAMWCAAIAGTLAHGRPIRTLLVPTRSFRWADVRKVLTLVLLLWLAVTLVEVVILPMDTTVEFSGLRTEHAWWLIPMMVLVLIQTSGEDAFFKGLLLHRIGAATKVTWLSPLLVTGVFVALHIGNTDLESELWLLLPLFVVSELAIVTLIIRTGGMEAALVLHWINNLTIFILLAERGTQANELTLLVWETPGSEAGLVIEEVRSAVLYSLFLIALFGGLMWPRSPFYLERYRPDPNLRRSIPDIDVG